MHTGDDHFHTWFLLIQRFWFGVLALYLIMTLAATAWERIAEDPSDQLWPVVAFCTATAGGLLTALAARRVRSNRGHPSTRV